MLSQLRDNQYFDLALAYLDRLEKGTIPPPASGKEFILIERGVTHQAAALVSRSEKNREKSLDDAEASFKEFLQQHGQHARADEARLQMAILQFARGNQLADRPKLDDAGKQRAKELLTASRTTFDEIVLSLRKKLESMQGQKVTEREMIELRDGYRGQYLLGMLYGGLSRKRIAELQSKGSPEAKKEFEEALKRFNELVDKHGNRLQGAMALRYRAEIEETLGNPDAAIDSYQRLEEFEEAAELHELKLQAATRLIGIWLSKSPPVYLPAIDLGKKKLEAINNRDRASPQVQALSLAVAKAYLAQADAFEKDKAGGAKVSGAKREAKKLLTAAARIEGEYQAEAGRLLKDLGIEVAAPAEVKTDIKTFADGQTQARELVEFLEGQRLTVALVQEQLRKNPNDESAKKELANLETEQAAKRQEAISVLQSTMRLAKKDTPVDDLVQLRIYFSHLLLQDKRNHEALVVANFIARKYPSNAMAPQAGLIALAGYQNLISANPDQVTPAIFQGLESLAKYLSERWPNEPSAASANEFLVRVMLQQNRMPEAKEYIKKIPADAPQSRTLKLLVGQLEWNAISQAGTTAATDLNQVDSAIVSLTEGLAGVQAGQLDDAFLGAALSLSRAYLKRDLPAQTMATLEHKEYGPLKMLSEKGNLSVKDPNFAPNVYRTALQALVSLATGDKPDPRALDRAAKVIDQLKKSVEGQPDADDRMIRNFLSLAQDIRGQLDTATPQRRNQLVDAFSLMLGKLLETSKEVSTLHWIGQTYHELGKSMLSNNPQGPAAGPAADLLKRSMTAFERSLENEPGSLEPQIRYESAQVARLLGLYKEAIEQLEKVLLANGNMLDAQIEAARTYQQWAAVGSEKLYEAAMAGGRKNPKTQQNTIWGWGKISMLTNGKPQHRESFFDARYALAECRLLMSKRVADKDQAKKLADQAKKDLAGIVVLYPDLGGDASKSRFNELMKKIQTALGEAAVGFDEVKPSSGIP
jgi:tetratricopeptide (TPR) repeat protein